MNQHALVEIISDICKHNAIETRTYNDGWVIEMNGYGATHRIIGQNFDLNSQAAAALASDKVAASTLLADNGISSVSHQLVDRFRGGQYDVTAIKSALTKGYIVLKPLQGASGNLVTRIGSYGQFERAVASGPNIVWAFSQWRDIAKEVRLVVVDGVIELALEKTDPVVIDGLRFFNLSKGATARSLTDNHIDDSIQELAQSAMHTLGLRMAAVDIIQSANGTFEVLEVNAQFSLMRYSKVNDTTRKEVVSFYDRLIRTLFTERVGAGSVAESETVAALDS